MNKVDYRKDLKGWYQPSAKEAVVVDLPIRHYLMIDGAGDPNTAPEYAAAVEALFTVSYAIKFMVKRGQLAVDYSVLPLEGLWWADDLARFSTTDKEGWRWTMMIMQPEIVAAAVIEAAVVEVRRKKKTAAAGRLRFESFSEGRCAQIMHLGPFTEEGPTITRLHKFIEDRGGKLTGKHHEIYLSDIRKADPANWKTVIRQPFS